VLVPLNYRNTAAETAELIASAEPDIVYVDAAYGDKLGAFAGPVAIGGDSSGEMSLEELGRAHAGQAPDVATVDLGEMNAIKFTGGSSGGPKGVVQSFRCINTLIASMQIVFGFRPDDVHLCVAPISHGAGSFMLPTLAAGGANRLMREARPADILAELAGGRVTTVFLPPTIIYAVMEASGGRRPDFPALRHVFYGAAPMPGRKVREARAFFGGRLEVVYGQTEMPVMIAAMTAREMADDRNIASVGRIAPLVSAAIVDPQGREVATGEVGEVVARGDLMMNGYYRIPDKTAETIVDGWLHTGDVGCIDERGYLFLKDRLRDVVISGGFNVFPSDVEAVLAEHPAVYECVVFGVPDERWGERVEAAVEPAAGARPEPAGLIAFVRERLGPVKAPKVVHVVDRLPRSPVGKVQRREARAMFGGGTGFE